MPRSPAAAANDPPLVRQWMLLRALAARRFGATVQEMSGELGVHEKTIRRDLAALSSVGFPLKAEEAERGLKRWRINATPAGHELTFAFDEALALYLGRRLLDPLAGTFLGDAAARAFRKIRAALGNSALSYLEKMTGSVLVTALGGGDYSSKAEAIDEILRAIEERKATHIVYRSQRATEPVTYEIHPYGVIYHRGSLYAVAFSRDHNELRHFKVDRIAEVEVSKFPFVMPAGFDLQSHLSKSFGMYAGNGDVRVKIEFAPDAARYVSESRWHSSQKLTKHRDGSLTAEFQLSGTEEIKRWIMSFGKAAEVLEPEGLRGEMLDEAADLFHRYSSDIARDAPT